MKGLSIDSVRLHAKPDKETFRVVSNTPSGLQLDELSNALNDEAAFVLSLAQDADGPEAILERKKAVNGFVSIKYSLTS
jgi:hypothetical protein